MSKGSQILVTASRIPFRLLKRPARVISRPFRAHTYPRRVFLYMTPNRSHRRARLVVWELLRKHNRIGHLSRSELETLLRLIHQRGHVISSSSLPVTYRYFDDETQRVMTLIEWIRR
jgi:hypothetical protein